MPAMTFDYWGRTLTGFNSMYNLTFLNERCVELAVAVDWLRAAHGDGLEVGNVLGHYNIAGHTIVDQFEKAAWYQPFGSVLNVDLFNYTARHDWIIAISTLEHVGHDFEPKDPTGARRAIAHLYGLLRPGGRMLVTVPTGHNPNLDELLLAGETGASKACTFQRLGRTDWFQTDHIVILPYGATTEWAEAVWIGEFDKP